MIPLPVAGTSSANEGAACVINTAAVPAAMPHRAMHEDDEAFLIICAPTRRHGVPRREKRCIGFAAALRGRRTTGRCLGTVVRRPHPGHSEKPNTPRAGSTKEDPRPPRGGRFFGGLSAV